MVLSGIQGTQVSNSPALVDNGCKHDGPASPAAYRMAVQLLAPKREHEVYLGEDRAVYQRKGCKQTGISGRPMSSAQAFETNNGSGILSFLRLDVV